MLSNEDYIRNMAKSANQRMAREYMHNHGADAQSVMIDMQCCNALMGCVTTLLESDDAGTEDAASVIAWAMSLLPDGKLADLIARNS